MKQYAGEEFLNKIYKDLVNSEIVKHTGTGGNKNADVAIYMDRLERVTKRSIEHDKMSLLKKFYYDKYVIKPEDVPNSYFEIQEKIALDRGYGHVKYDDKTKKQEINNIISEQRASLDSWIDYFASSDTEHYPTWFKYFVFQGMIKLGYFDKEKNRFTKRTPSTTKPFIEINREAIAMVYDELVKVLDKQELDDKALEVLIKNGSFSKIYAYCITKLDSIKKNNFQSDEGVWKKYNQGSDPEILFNDIHGKGTGWCTAGGLETAKIHLNGGDFYVYFTKNELGEYANPRIAIRTNYGKLAEIRGIAQNQNLESNMERVVSEKIKEFPDREEYEKKVKDMEMLTYIYTKWQNKGELTKKDLRFVYEIDGRIIGFGYQKDPRIEEILSGRNKRTDLVTLLDCKEENISFTKEEALSENIIYHYGDLDLGNLTSANGLVLPKTITGNLWLNGLTSAEGLKLPETITGDLDLGRLKSAKDLVFPKTITGVLKLEQLTNAENLKFPETVVGNLYLNGLTSADGLVFPETVDGCLWLNGLTRAKDLVFPKTITGSLFLELLENAENLKFPETITGDLDLGRLKSAEGLVLPETITGSLFLNELTSAEGVKLPKTITGDLGLSGLTSANGLVLPKEMLGSLDLRGITSADDLVLPKAMLGSLDLRGITSAEGLVLPKTIIGNLDLRCLTSADDLVLPETIAGNLDLSGLTSAEGLKLPVTMYDSLILSGLTSAEGLKLPKTITGDLGLSGLTSAEGLKLPKTITGSLDLSGITSAEGLKLPKTITGDLGLSGLTSAEGLVLPDDFDISRLIAPSTVIKRMKKQAKNNIQIEVKNESRLLSILKNGFNLIKENIEKIKNKFIK